MDIARAKEQIKSAIKAYFTKDEFGSYRIPIEKQRPVLLMGPPGIGKTAVMEQIASELGVGLVSYSMTHHTRQSALGLPYITEQEYNGTKYRVSEYTMSEIIGSIYKLMRETGVKEGILFLDEINCVSETLAPCMLQFLQYKVFGQHRVPDGWILVAAGNPPEYNKSVRDFDTVTWDRLKRIDIEPDYATWARYASEKGVHPAVLTYLESKKADFYIMENTAEGKRFVTARGWDDLSQMIYLFEENGLKVDRDLIVQYVQHPRVAGDFAIYYDLFNKYRSDYKIESILSGVIDESIVLRAQRAQPDERLSVLGLFFSSVTGRLKTVCEYENALDLLAARMKNIKQNLDGGKTVDILLEEETAELASKLSTGRQASSLSLQEQREYKRALLIADEFRSALKGLAASGKETFDVLREAFSQKVEVLKKTAKEGGSALDNAFSFCEQAFRDGDEILIFVTELTANYYCARFIGHYGCEKYWMHNKELQFAERREEITRRIDALNFDF